MNINLSQNLVRYKLFLILLILLVLTVIPLVLSRLKPQQKGPRVQVPVSTSQFKTDGLVFSDPKDKTRFDEFLSLGLNAKEKSEKSNYLTKAFVYLSSEYNRKPTSDKRESLELLLSYLKANFSNETKAAALSIPCKEEACGAKFVYSPELTEIKNLVLLNGKTEGPAKEVILLNIENAALAAGKNDKLGEFNSLLTCFTNLKTAWNKNKDQSVKLIAQKVLILMQKVDSENYKNVVRLGNLRLE